MKINIRTDKNNLKNNNALFNDYYLNELVIFYINTENRTNISTFIRSIFYLDLNEEYYETYLDFSALYPMESDKFLFIYNLFNEWNPSEKYSMHRWRGIFLELLTYTLLKQVYSEEEINRESLVTIDKFRTNPIDFIVQNDNKYQCYECKFSSHSIKKNQIDLLLGLKNKSNSFTIYLVLFELQRNTIQNITSKHELRYLSDKINSNDINLVTLDDFRRDNPFI